MLVQGVQKRSIIIFHTLAHLDLGLWHSSPWIHVLTLQYMQCKYALLFVPTWAPHKPNRCRMKQKEGNFMLCVCKDSYTFEWFEGTIWGVRLNYVLSFENLIKNSKYQGVKKGRWLCFENYSISQHLKDIC